MAQHLIESLSDKQRGYLEARLEGLSIIDSALRAGYTENYARSRASKILEKHPTIRTIMRQTNQRAADKLQLNRESVLNGLLDAVDAAATATELVMAWREIGKVIGAYEPTKVEIDVNNLTAAQLRGMSGSELAALAGMDRVFEGEFERMAPAEALEAPNE